MSSLRLALKQSLEESLPHPPNKKRGRPKASPARGTTTTGRPRGRPPKRKPGDPPRKRGRPRKHPLPEEEAQALAQQRAQKNVDEDDSSSEAEFSVSHEDSEHSEEEQEYESSEDELEKMRKQRKMQKKAMKHSAANKIQTHWKKKRRPSVDETLEEKQPHKSGEDEPLKQDGEKKNTETSGKAKTVPPPDADLVSYMRELSVKKQKRNMAAGLRVKVRFATKVRKRDGKVATKLKWYGGLVTRVSTGGSKIRIKYDDGTSEVSKFPDKDVIVDETGNGEHRVSAGRFLPPAQRAAAAARELQNREQEDSEKKRPASPKKLIRSSSTSKVEKEDEHESSKPSPPSCELPRAVQSPRREMAEKCIAASPERDEAPTVSGEVDDENDHVDSDAKMDESSETGADTPDVPKSSRGERKKPTLKIRLKGPKACIVTSASQDVMRGKSHSFSEEEDHGDDSSYGEDDAMSVEEDTREKRPIQEKGDDEEESVAKSPYAATESAEEASQSLDNHYARKKRSYDRVSGYEVSEEPPRKKRAGGEAPGSEHSEQETEFVEQSDESMEAVEEKPVSGEKMSENGEEGIEVPLERKRKREDQHSPQESPRREAESLTPESADLKASSSDADEQKLDPVEQEAIKEESESAHEGGEAKVTESKDDSNEAAPAESVAVETDAARSKAPLSLAQEAAVSADDSASKGEAAAAASIPRFGRRAAQQANERIAARKEIIIQDEFAKKKKQRKEKADLKLFAAAERKGKLKDNESGDDDEGVWVQCDDCSKWRLLPSSVQSDELPKHWYCRMNIYDPDRNTCDAPEQTAQEIAKEKRRRKKRLAKIARLEADGKIDAETAAAQRLTLENRERKSARSKELRAARSPGALKVSHDEDIELDIDKAAGSRTTRRSPTQNEDRTESPTAETGSDSQKPRPYKKQSSFGSAGRKSKSDADDGDNVDGDINIEPVPKKRGRGRPPRPRAHKDVGNKESDKGKGTKGGANDSDNQEWVQCELCQKWRRLPPHVSADSLPDTWYCTMNTWNSRAANCEAAEDKADPGHQEFGIYGSGISAASYGNKLSYRNLIFGTGRKQNRIVTERARAAESLFLAPTDPSSENVSYPKVMYANSSVFMPRTSNAHKSNAPDKEKRVSLFELMSHSNLWAELFAAKPDVLGSSSVNSSYDYLSGELKQTMKQMVLHAIDARTLACDEVLLELQCRQWIGVPQEWAEIRASFTVDKVEGSLRDLVADGLVESVASETLTDLSGPKYRCVSAKTSALENKEVSATRCMKIAKPWKRKRPNMTREWLK